MRHLEEDSTRPHLAEALPAGCRLGGRRPPEGDGRRALERLRYGGRLATRRLAATLSPRPRGSSAGSRLVASSLTRRRCRPLSLPTTPALSPALFALPRLKLRSPLQWLLGPTETSAAAAQSFCTCQCARATKGRSAGRWWTPQAVATGGGRRKGRAGQTSLRAAQTCWRRFNKRNPVWRGGGACVVRRYLTSLSVSCV